MFNRTDWLLSVVLVVTLLSTGCGSHYVKKENLEQEIKKQLDQSKKEAAAEKAKEIDERLKAVEKALDDAKKNEKDPTKALQNKTEELEKRIKAIEDKDKKGSEEKGKKGATPEDKTQEKGSGSSGSTKQPFENPLFANLGFGLGVGAMVTFGRTRVGSATVDNNNIVRITKEENFTPGVMLESHLLLKTCEWAGDCSDREDNETRWANGPFVFLSPGDSQLIKAIGVGWMIGYRYAEDDKNKRSFNLGVALAIQPNSQTLGDGLKPNQPLPSGDSLRYQDRTLMGLTVLLSHGF